MPADGGAARDDASASEPASDALAEQNELLKTLKRLMAGVFLLFVVGALYFARDFFVPVVLAFLFALTLTPIVRFLGKRGVPAALSATLLVLATFMTLGAIGYLLSGPVAALVEDAPQIGREVKARLAEIRNPFDRFMEATEQMDEATDPAASPDVQEVVIAQPGVVSQAAGNLVSAGTTAAITMVLCLFLLASGTLFYEKTIQSFSRLSDKKRALRVVYDVEREISRYLFTIALINTGLGVVTGFGLWVLGMPTPLVWGVFSALLNFLPYIGALINIVLVGMISLVTFDDLSYALLPPLFVFLCNVVEGQFLTPAIVGRRLEINSVSVFIAVAFWSWLWGFVGALIAVPLLVVIKVFCDNFDGLRAFGNFLSAAHATEEDAEKPAVQAGSVLAGE